MRIKFAAALMFGSVLSSARKDLAAADVGSTGDAGQLTPKPTPKYEPTLLTTPIKSNPSFTDPRRVGSPKWRKLN
jgi:hypothetical protein